MARSDRELFRAARRAYERGRLVHALRRIWWPLPVAWLASRVCCSGLHACVAAIGAALWIVLLGWRGQALERALLPGFVAGLAAGVLPMICLGLCTPETAWAIRFGICCGGGLCAGVMVGLMMRRGPDAAALLVGAIPLALAIGSLGCISAGIAGVLGMAIALSATAVPFVWTRADQPSGA